MLRIRPARAASVALAAAMLGQGCAALAPTPDAGPAPHARPAARFEVHTGRPGLVIGAPDPTSDTSADAIARELARLTGFGLVVATGVAGAGAYRRSVREASRGPLRLYVEVRGNGHEDSVGRVEIATVGLSREDAWRVKTLLELVRDAHVAGVEGLPRLEIRVESLDPLRDTRSAWERAGMLGASDRALHIELPAAARTTHRRIYTDVLADFLNQSAALLLVPGP